MDSEGGFEEIQQGMQEKYNKINHGQQPPEAFANAAEEARYQQLKKVVESGSFELKDAVGQRFSRACRAAESKEASVHDKTKGSSRGHSIGVAKALKTLVPDDRAESSRGRRTKLFAKCFWIPTSGRSSLSLWCVPHFGPRFRRGPRKWSRCGMICCVASSWLLLQRGRTL